MSSEILTAELIEQFQRDGAVVLRNVFSKQWLEKIERGIEKNKASPSEYSENLRAEGGPGYYFNDYCNWQTIEEFTDFAYNSPAAELAGKLMKSTYAVFYHEHVLTKDAGTSKVTPWHQDQPYYPIDGFKNLSIWMPIDPVSKATSIQFVQGSHRWGKWFHPRKFATTKNYVIEKEGLYMKNYEEVPDIGGNPADYEVLQWDVQPGDCVVFHMLSLHGAPANDTSTARRVLSTRWLGDDTVLGERPWTESPPVYGGLNPGDTVMCETFPLIWKQN